MSNKITVKVTNKGALEFNVNMTDGYIIKVIASLEEYISKKIDLPICDIRDIIDEEKKDLTARLKN